MPSSDGPAPTLGIGQVAARTGLSVHALRFYEREGILADPVRRASGGRRRYTEGDVEWLRLCTILRASGMPIPEIRRYTELARAGAGTEPGRLALLRAHEQRVLDQIAELRRSLDIVRHKVAVYEDYLDGGDAGRDCGLDGQSD
ncbi:MULTISPECIES: MerR family transcriptional regulator [Kitasatospora]|uniref:Putative MerR family transcriptional regulator n=1 Tax=Kitasatospora setae (strain ATCC 33774 / DSM 43861 / JCM 3304 / KCC A-0304 / NBRC 14216 / KM-6054) TaxID=452652 RepID=E4N7G2_KITSK|nr:MULTISPECIES: MerR family transcriptional regulator [Kitasatospora]BAJ27143.1 putative MerR family transcriptional regulator [Kitasatospora setae KM-6054]